MNPCLALILIVLCTIGGISAEGGDAALVFAENGYTPLVPSKTLILLKNLAATRKNMVNASIGQIERGEIDDLVSVAGITEEKCNQKYVDHINNMLLKYARYLLNVVPYLQYNKQKLLSECAERYNVKDLDQEVNIPGEVWSRKYREVFQGEAGYMDPKKTFEVIKSLYETYEESLRSDELKSKGSEVADLLKLSQPKGCYRRQFDAYENSLKKYAYGFRNAIYDYVKYQQSKFWQACKQYFLESQRLIAVGGLIETEAFSLVDHITAHISFSRESFLMKEVLSIQGGFFDYVKDKLQKKACNKDKLDALFIDTVFVCHKVDTIFSESGKISEIIGSRPELGNYFDKKSIKWLTAIGVCRIIIDNAPALKYAALSKFQKQHQEGKANSCFGKYFAKIGNRKDKVR